MDIETILLRTMGYLREVQEIDQQIEEIRNNIIESSGSSSGERVQSSTLGDQTFTKANRIISTTNRLERRKEVLNQRLDLIHNALGKLDRDQFEAINLMYFKGDSAKEIAETLNVSVSTIHRRVRSAKDKMIPDLRPLMS